ncbi:MAG: hypothetical protein ACR2J8_10860 [Thermomicrobiales bacterium]
MDQDRFESLSRAVAAGTSRRATLRTLLGLGVAGVAGKQVVASVAAEDVDEQGVPIVHCKVPGEICQKDKACCSGTCKGGLCTCFRKGHACWEPGEGIMCCSGRCRNGKCK